MALMVVVNGSSREFAELAPGATVSVLVAAMELKSDRVAVERNGEIVARGRWGEVELAEGDRLEVVHFVGGGRPVR